MTPATTSQLTIARAHSRSVVTRARSVAPLRLLAPAGTGDAAWVYQSSLGGGFVGRDRVELAVEVAAEARLFLTSQASSKVYRGAASHSRLDATVGDGGVLVAWPDPIACFAGAAFDQHQRFRLAGSAALIAVDAWTAGRIAHGECWAFARLALRTEVEIDGILALHDATLVMPAHGALDVRMAGARAFATIILAGARFAGAVAAIAHEVAAAPVTAQPRLAVSVWPWGGVVRIAAAAPELLTRTIHQLIHPAVRDVLGADPFARKW